MDAYFQPKLYPLATAHLAVWDGFPDQYPSGRSPLTEYSKSALGTSSRGGFLTEVGNHLSPKSLNRRQWLRAKGRAKTEVAHPHVG